MFMFLQILDHYKRFLHAVLKSESETSYSREIWNTLKVSVSNKENAALLVFKNLFRTPFIHRNGTSQFIIE